MAQIANAKIVILWDHQLMAAAQALRTARLAEDAAKAEGKTESEDVDRLWMKALNACYAALYSPELADGSQVTVLNAKRAAAEIKPT